MPTDEQALMQDMHRAARAKALLEDETLMGAFDALREQYLKAWENTASGDTAGRERLFLAMRTLPAVKGNLETLLMNGSIAVKQLANLEEDRRLKNR